MNSYTDLKAWQTAMNLIEEIYTITGKFPRSELFALTSQLRRSSVSIALNTAEGFGRYSFPEKAHKYTIARGECKEVEAGIIIAMRLGFLKESDVKKVLQYSTDTAKMLSGLIKSCKSQSK